jgi:hypothetical protein
MTETLCVCGHAAEPHQHHRDGEDCSRCGRELCPEFRPLTWWRRVLQRCGWYPAPLPDPVPAVDLTSLFMPARFARGGTLPPPVDSDSVPVRLSPGGWLAEPVLSPEQWERVARDLPDEPMGPWFVPHEPGQPAPLVGRGGVSVGCWVMLDGQPEVIGEVVDVDHLGVLCEVRVPGKAENRIVLCERVRVIA